MTQADANKATSRAEDGPKPLTEAERFYVDQHPHTPLAELARVLGRDEAFLAGLLPERAPAFERLLQPIKRDGKTVGTVWNPAASAAMDEKRKHNPERPASAEEPADKDKFVYSPMGGRRKAPTPIIGRPVYDSSSAKSAAPEPQLDQAPVEITQPSPEQAAAKPPRKAGAYTMGGTPQSIHDRR
jgi:hypothetical protein